MNDRTSKRAVKYRTSSQDINPQHHFLLNRLLRASSHIPFSFFLYLSLSFFSSLYPSLLLFLLLLFSTHTLSFCFVFYSLFSFSLSHTHPHSPTLLLSHSHSLPPLSFSPIHCPPFCCHHFTSLPGPFTAATLYSSYPTPGLSLFTYTHTLTRRSK